MSAPLELRPVEQIDTIRPVWDALAQRAGNPFVTYEWAESWWRHRGRGSLHVHLACDPAGPVAVLPLFQAAGRLRFLGDRDADVVEPVCAPEDRARAAEALGRLARAGPAAMLDARWMPADHPWSEQLGGTVLEDVPAPVLHIAGRSWEQFLAGRSRNFRSQVRRRRRSLEQSFALDIRMTTNPGELPRDLDVLAMLHRRRFGRTSAVFDGARGDFHREWAAAALGRGWLRLWTLSLDGAPAAVLYVFRFGGVDWFYQGGRDPGFEHERVGFVLLCHAVADAFGAGQRAFSFLRGGEAYKGRFSDVDLGVRRIAVGRGSAGAALIAGARGRRRLAGLRSWLR